MSTFKKIILVLVIIIAIAAIIGMLMPSSAHIERSLTMKAPVENVFYQVNELKNWNNWMPFNKMDTAMKINWGAKTEGEGASYSWESTNSNVGKGSINITKSAPNQSIETALHFEGMADATSAYTMAKVGDGTKVTWSFDGSMGSNPFKKLMRPMMEKMMGNIFDRGLRDLDSSSLKNAAPQAANFQIEMTTVQPMYYMALRDSATPATIAQKLGMDYGIIGAALKKQNLQMINAPMTIYHSDSETGWEIDAAVPVDKPGKPDGKVQPGEIKGGNAIVAHYYGPYDKMSDAWRAVKQYLADNNKTKNGNPWEQYITDPGAEKDTSKWLTNIYFPVQ